jgi:hypothetical protein
MFKGEATTKLLQEEAIQRTLNRLLLLGTSQKCAFRAANHDYDEVKEL